MEGLGQAAAKRGLVQADEAALDALLPVEIPERVTAAKQKAQAQQPKPTDSAVTTSAPSSTSAIGPPTKASGVT